MIEDRRGALWIGSINGIYRLLPDGRAEHYDGCHGLPLNSVRSLLADREGRVWASAESVALCRLVSDPDPRSEERRVGKECRSGWWAELLERKDETKVCGW